MVNSGSNQPKFWDERDRYAVPKPLVLSLGMAFFLTWKPGMSVSSLAQGQFLLGFGMKFLVGFPTFALALARKWDNDHSLVHQWDKDHHFIRVKCNHANPEELV